MTAKYAVNDEQKARYLAREGELRGRFLKGVLEPAAVLDGLQALMEKPVIRIITAPDLPAKALLALAEEQAGLMYLNPDYQKYAFIRDERGRIYEVLTWKPGRGVSSDAVREHFSALGFAGNTAAFISWVVKNHPEGWYASIPENDQCFVGGGGLYAPYFFRGCLFRKLDLRRLAVVWHGGYVFVAFREIPQK